MLLSRPRNSLLSFEVAGLMLGFAAIGQVSNSPGQSWIKLPSESFPLVLLMRLANMFLSILLSCCVQHPDAEVAIDDLVALHQVSVGSIHQVDFVLEVYSGKNFDLGEILRYSSDGTSERLRSEAVRFPADTPKRFVDVIRDENASSRLEGRDPRKKVVIEDPFEARGIVGSRMPPLDVEASFGARSKLNLRFSIDTSDRHRTLADLVADSRAVHGATGVTMLPKALVHEASCFHLRILHPGLVNLQTGMQEHESSEFHVFLDPSVGCLARRCELHRRQRPSDVLYVITNDITEFKEFPNSVYFPMLAVGTDLYGNEKPLPVNPKCEFRVSNLTLNQALPDDALDFYFPENLLVADTVSTESPILVWMGKDNQTLKEFDSDDELNVFLTARQGDNSSPKRQVTIWVALANICILAFVVYALYRRRRRRRIE